MPITNYSNTNVRTIHSPPQPAFNQSDHLMLKGAKSPWIGFFQEVMRLSDLASSRQAAQQQANEGMSMTYPSARAEILADKP